MTPSEPTPFPDPEITFPPIPKTTSKPANWSLSLRDRQRRDIQAVGCILIEILSSSHMHEYEDMTWERYLAEAELLWARNRNDIFLWVIVNLDQGTTNLPFYIYFKLCTNMLIITNIKIIISFV